MKRKRVQRYDTEEVIRLLTCRKQAETAWKLFRWCIPFAAMLVPGIPYLCWIMVSTYGPMAATRAPSVLSHIMMLYLFIFPLLAMVIPLAFGISELRSLHANALRGLQATGDDVRLAGPLAESLRVKHRDLRAKVEEKLTRVLGLLRGADAELLNRAQREGLHRALFGKNEDLTLAILQALAEIGDVSALPSVQRLAQGKEASARVREEAEECAKVLQARLEATRSRESLLRPAVPAIEPAGTLLRAATPADRTPAEQLLRASDSREDR